MSDERSIEIDMDDSAFLAWTDEVSQLVFDLQQRHNDERRADQMKRNPWLVLQALIGLLVSVGLWYDPHVARGNHEEG